MIDIVFWFERGRTDGAVARAWNGERFHTRSGKDFLAAIAECVRVTYAGEEGAVVRAIALGKERCPTCRGVGGAFVTAAGWVRCRACDGLGQTWRAGGPGFDCSIELSERDPGEVVELGTGERVRIMWHSPRKNPVTTFVSVFDDFTDEYDPAPVPVFSSIGVRSVAIRARAPGADLHEHEKDADLVDPIARRQREADGLV